MPTPPRGSARSHVALRLHRRPTLWVGLGLIVGALVMIAWVIELATTLRGSVRVHNWDSLWVGLDIAEMVALVGTGICLIRRSPYTDVIAGMGAVLFALDAWIDVLTSSGTAGEAQSIMLACWGEIPLILVLGALAWRARRWFGHARPAAEPGAASSQVLTGEGAAPPAWAER